MAETDDATNEVVKKRKKILFYIGGVCVLAILLFGGVYFGSDDGERLAQSGDMLFGGGSINTLREDPTEETKEAEKVGRIPGNIREENKEDEDDKDEEASEIAGTGSSEGSTQIPETGMSASIVALLPAGVAVYSIVEYYRSRTALWRAAISRRDFSQHASLF